jgi:hypothetical protein
MLFAAFFRFADAFLATFWFISDISAVSVNTDVIGGATMYFYTA